MSQHHNHHGDGAMEKAYKFKICSCGKKMWFWNDMCQECVTKLYEQFRQDIKAGRVKPKPDNRPLIETNPQPSTHGC